VAGTCPICDSATGKPRDVLVELNDSWVTAPAEACLPGYVCVVAREHVVEPFELVDGSRWWAECMAVARALKVALRSTKINYEIHGNTLPHLHMHLYPRFEGDPYVGRPIDGAARGFVRSTEELERMRTAVTAVSGR